MEICLNWQRIQKLVTWDTHKKDSLKCSVLINCKDYLNVTKDDVDEQILIENFSKLSSVFQKFCKVKALLVSCNSFHIYTMEVKNMKNGRLYQG